MKRGGSGAEEAQGLRLSRARGSNFVHTKSLNITKSYFIIRNHTMKNRITITIESETVRKLDWVLKNKSYRNRSHAVEQAVLLLHELESKKAGVKNILKRFGINM